LIRLCVHLGAEKDRENQRRRWKFQSLHLANEIPFFPVEDTWELPMMMRTDIRHQKSLGEALSFG
jgi:hypothetical protein